MVLYFFNFFTFAGGIFIVHIPDAFKGGKTKPYRTSPMTWLECRYSVYNEDMVDFSLFLHIVFLSIVFNKPGERHGERVFIESP